MNVLDVLKDDHATVERLFSTILATSATDLGRRNQLFDALKEAILKHAHAEEAVFYPALRDRQPAHDMVEHGIGEHHAVAGLLARMNGIPADSDDWIDTLGTIREKLLDHVREEEGDIFPKARQLLGDDRLDEMARTFLSAKEHDRPH
ncbi:hemerythrin domain-containing protein [Magnetospirillum sp. UT-4]|uniref:hemerythrin domain-containing protein n=1 Tax=Magnetospirillum sp. UT-4 TaxID=2681467 RepID=UPI00138498C1|nr:hemerythrin domain-containing protein [Magnetospirillum sp. UT-4]CAA7622611.1 putative Hemerythrin HHE cation binding region [Magnetospirillum sp. UT-4]